MKFLLPVACCLLSVALSSQDVPDDKLLNSKPSIIGGLSTRNTFIYGFNAPVISIKLGAEFRKQFRIGAAFCFLKEPKFKGVYDREPFIYRKPIVHESGQLDTVPNYLKLNYFAYFTEYVYYDKGRWEFSIPVQIGFGQSFYQYEVDGMKKRELESPVLLYEPSVSVQFRILRWLAAGAEVGYRFMLVNNKVAGNHFNSPVYDLKLMILWRELMKAPGIMKSKGK